LVFVEPTKVSHQIPTMPKAKTKTKRGQPEETETPDTSPKKKAKDVASPSGGSKAKKPSTDPEAGDSDPETSSDDSARQVPNHKERSKSKKAPEVATATVATAKLGDDIHELAGAITSGFSTLNRKHDQAFAQGEKIIAALGKVAKELSGVAKISTGNLAPPVPVPTTLPPPGKFSLANQDLPAIASTATQLYYSIGGWSVRWDADRTALINEVTQMAIAHSKKNCTMEMLDPDVQVSHRWPFIEMCMHECHSIA
jgi:hypothetical protein